MEVFQVVALQGYVDDVDGLIRELLAPLTGGVWPPGGAGGATIVGDVVGHHIA